MTFSKSLANHINHLCADQYQVQRMKLVVGRKLQPGEPSKSGMYALMSHKDRLLRVTLSQEQAEAMCDWDWRYLAEAWYGGVV